MKFDASVLRLWRPPVVILAVLVLAGFGLRPIVTPAWAELRDRQPALRLETIEGALGQGVTVGLLGGFRAIIADFFWLRANVVWERRDLPGTRSLIKLVTAVDPRPLYFWLNGSRMIAYDMPHWRITAAGGNRAVPEAVQRQIDLEQAEMALELLNEARGHHAASAALWVEVANIHLNRRKDLMAAADAYRQAAAQPDAPYYAARIYAELLRRMGRTREAHHWLVQLYPTLPKSQDHGPSSADEVEAAMADVVLQRIRELEQDLGVPENQRFNP